MLFIFNEYFKLNTNKDIINTSSLDSEYDILKPKFIINNENKKISITANKGNFIKNDNVMLKENVLFKSDKFQIYSDDVIFNKNEQTAKSEKDSIFLSEGANIKSEGFDLTDKGNIIKFNGKTLLTLTK
jgi:hypothetical protein